MMDRGRLFTRDQRRRARMPRLSKGLGVRRAGWFVSGMIWLLRTSWSVGSLLAGLVGLPWPLYRLSRAVLAAIDLREAIVNPLTMPVVVLAAVCIGWLMWGWLLYATVADFIDAARRFGGTGPVRIPLPFPRCVAQRACTPLPAG